MNTMKHATENANQETPNSSYVAMGAEPRRSLTFDALREANLRRCPEAFHELNEWSPTDWATAMAGECGEACNLIKKLRRGEPVATPAIADELADLVIYADLLAARLGIDLNRAVIRKFNEVSDRMRPLSTVHL